MAPTDRRAMEDSKIETLITFVQQHPKLWDKSKPGYSTITAKQKNDLWSEIGDLLHCPWEKCFNKWKNLLREFRTEIKSQPRSRSGDAASNYEPKFRWYERMKFVEKVVKARKSTGNTTPLFSEPSDASDNENEAYDSDEFFEGESVPQRKTKPTRAVQVLARSTAEGPRGSSIPTVKPVAQLQEHEHYLRSILPRIRHLENPQSILFRGDFTELVMKFAYEESGLYANRE